MLMVASWTSARIQLFDIQENKKKSTEKRTYIGKRIYQKPKRKQYRRDMDYIGDFTDCTKLREGPTQNARHLVSEVWQSEGSGRYLRNEHGSINTSTGFPSV